MNPVLTPRRETTPRTPWGLEQLPPEPVEWQPPPPALTRVLRATSTPIVTAVVVFLVVLLATAATIWFGPHTFAAEQPLETETATNGGEATLLGETATSSQLIPETSQSTSQSTALYVHVVGEVNRPGVVQLEDGARVTAAIEAAGGATADAVLEGINLARLLIDGEQILVPNASQATADASGVGAATHHDGRVNLNTADAAALETLPRVGPSLAAKIIAWREANGGFHSVDQLLDVSGIGQKTLEELAGLVMV